jgi:hypothetical protein
VKADVRTKATVRAIANVADAAAVAVVVAAANHKMS